MCFSNMEKLFKTSFPNFYLKHFGKILSIVSSGSQVLERKPFHILIVPAFLLAPQLCHIR